jgi:alpha-D-ribose 1-methylphosphonate 5-triphosphate synthase subunit PhnH
MSALAEVKPYDPIFDAQKHYRTLLQSTARPGSIGQLDDTLLDIPPKLSRSTAHILMALLSADSSFHLDQCEEAAEFVQRETSAKLVNPGQADFVVLADPRRLDALRQAKIGTLLYPDLGATVIVQVAAISPAPIPGAQHLRLNGPGIESEAGVNVAGAPSELFEILRERNAEFPMGVDVFLTCDSLSAGPCVMALPRTTHIRWYQV